MNFDVLTGIIVIAAIEEAIANAAQTLGMKTTNPEELKDLVEGKFVDALRAVAAEMAMIELHEQRVDFVQKVQQAVSEDLLKNGLELESVSLTGLDQTSKEFFNPDNAFDAEGLTKLTEEIQARRKKRNDIEQDTEVSVANKNLEAERQKLEIKKEEEYARLQQEREIEIRRAAQISEIAIERAAKQKEAEQVQIAAQQEIDRAKIVSERAIEEERIEKERQIRQKEIAKAKAKAKAIETDEIEQKKAIELAEQGRSIAIAQKSREKSEAQADADKARALAVKEEEAVVTVRETEVAERKKAVELVEAKKLAEREAIKVKIAAETEKQAAEDKADSVKILANAEAEKERIAATASADAEMVKAEAAKKRYAVEAEGKRALNEADNILSESQVAMQVRMALLKYLPDIIRESVKPMEKIDGIKIVHVDGLHSVKGSVSENGDANATHNLADDVVNSALRYRSQAPLIDSLLADIGLKAGDINGFAKGLVDGAGEITK